MVPAELNIYEYENILMKKTKSFSCSFKGTFQENCTEVGVIWRYAVTRLLKWTPQQALKYLTADIVNMLRLDKTFPAINYNPKRDYAQDYRFVLQYAFPGIITFNKTDETISEYERFAKIGVWANDKEQYRCPKNFFLNNEGIARASILFNYVISLYLGDMTIEELYAFFANTKKSKKWLKEKQLDIPLDVIYTDPLEYLHFSLPADSRDELLFYAHYLNNRFLSHCKVTVTVNNL